VMEPDITSPQPLSPASTFVVRFWPDRSAGGLHWRGRIEHVQSHESTAFGKLEELIDFVQGFGVMVDGSGPASARSTVCESGDTKGD
jgi:hypothetical protein